MGIPKHGKNSARSKNSAKYTAEHRYQKNKARKAERHRKRVERFAIRREGAVAA